MCADRTIRYDPSSSTPGHELGHEGRLREVDLARLAGALLSATERKRVAGGPAV
jgi:hypothetical protein